MENWNRKNIHVKGSFVALHINLTASMGASATAGGETENVVGERGGGGGGGGGGGWREEKGTKTSGLPMRATRSLFSISKSQFLKSVLSW